MTEKFQLKSIRIMGYYVSNFVKIHSTLSFYHKYKSGRLGVLASIV